MTCAMHMEERARDEALGILRGLGDPGASVEITWYTGLLVARTGLDPVGVAAAVGRRVADEPWSVRYCLRMVPVQRTVRATEEDIVAEAGFVAGMIPEGATYKILVKKRGTSLSGTSLIRAMASRIPNAVRMEGPDRLVRVEVIQGEAGISVLREGDVMSLHGAKLGLSG